MTAGGNATVYIVDDDRELRESLRDLIAKDGFIASSYPTADDFLQSFEEPAIGCVLLDLRMPGLNGLELQLELNRRECKLPIIFLTGHGDIRAAVGAVKRGAFDFVEKPFDNHELLELIKAAVAKSRMDAEQREKLARQMAQLAQLTEREREVHERLIAGKTNKIIGPELGISERTVEFHRANVMKKMQAGSLAELIELSGQTTGTT
ncbi:MAG: response regulator transcription factor [Alphaproteobacteria bacterium]|nr:response regulator transcription factor [Alphaproteobacteria bacterium]